jgi:DNA-binding transcriptional regulator YdaS (Cro superfamily)
MAFLGKASGVAARTSVQAPVLEQWIRVSRATDTLPATTTEAIFNVLGGRILLKALIGEVTTVIQTQACNLSVNVDSDAGASDVLASTLDISAGAVGTYYGIEGDGTAVENTGIGWGRICTSGGTVIGTGTITLTTSATNTGSVKWDLYYLPLEENSYVTATAV